ncbi:GlxA family transcriptional regulator [Streptomyces antimycoticus]|uniref:GlxA family transcriptional regulator n=1 Tax=Streptomyces antimycoticus TaxID=68175 RepID=UPI0037D10F80
MPIVAVIGLDQVIGFELMLPGQAFGMANAAEADMHVPGSGTKVMDPYDPAVPGRYEVRVCAQGRSVSTVAAWGKTQIQTPYDLEAVVDADIVVVPGTSRFLEPPPPEVADVLREAAARGSRIASVCVGAFTVAASGLLDGLRATTHWQWAGELARRYPAVDVDPAVLFIDNGQILTSAGVASGLDVCLHLIRSDAGAELAARTARRIIMPPWRDGGQSQFIEYVDPEISSNSLQSTIGWMQENLASPLDLHTIAEHAAMSVRSLNRQFRQQVGTTPQQLLLQMRVDRARQLLETTELTMDRVAEQSGFGSHATLRHHFSRLVGTSPHAYRCAFNADRRTGTITQPGTTWTSSAL